MGMITIEFTRQELRLIYGSIGGMKDNGLYNSIESPIAQAILNKVTVKAYDKERKGDSNEST